MNHLVYIRQWLALVFLMLFVSLAACRGGSEEEVTEDLEPPNHLHDTAWLVTAYQDGEGELVEVLEGTEG